ncbi:EAL domain-containing protein [Azospirillum sp.]|uniref:EAL domain-containing response regulator n=1 Tax=Azospirillum sp. TaxID=34012 RepID=UPI002627C4E3|nr:EAL domain-containing protein [Azospirillum sp.]
MSADDHDDLLAIIEDDESAGVAAAPERVWRMLLVDDDDEVHLTTAYSLQGVEILGRKLELSHARSGTEALDLLRRDSDYAVILLDVVMETSDAGLRLVRMIREDLGLSSPRIILRTGQPGYAPELAVIRDYDINDYRTKSELTRTRLLTSLYAALRAYNHIQALETSRRGLEQIIGASAELFRRNSLTAFCEGILIQLGSLLDIEASGIVLARTKPALNGLRQDIGSNEPVILAAAGPFRHLAGEPLSRVADESLRTLLRTTLEQRTSVFQERATVLHIRGRSGDDLAIFLATGRAVGPVGRQLLEVFSSNVALGFDNASLLDHIRALAYFDPLTRLPNRTLFQDEVAASLTRLRSEGGGKLAILLIDLDHFQTVNDGLGYRTGDALLQAVAQKLNGSFAEAGAVSRLAGDLFGVQVRLPNPGDETILLRAIQTCFADPFLIGGHPITVRVSGGYTLADAAELDVNRQIRRAGIALKRAKRDGRDNILHFDAAMEDELHRRLSLVNRIAEAQSTNQFSLMYQPQLRLSDGAVIGVEALLRWRRPDGSWIRPDTFIPVAEDAGHIVWLGEWVLREACQHLIQWRQRGLGRLRMAVNVSVRQLRDDNFLSMTERVLKECGVDPTDIELEITESNAMEDDHILSVVQTLRKQGFSIAIDDFGTGYSSLSRLQKLPASVLKIDRSFVLDIDRRAENRSIAAMIVKVGHELGMMVLAEGVESPTQESTLRDLLCDSGQGYLYAKPLPFDALEGWLQDRKLAAP